MFIRIGLVIVGWMTCAPPVRSEPPQFEESHGLWRPVEPVAAARHKGWDVLPARPAGPILPVEVTGRFSPAYRLIFGDTDHDGRTEVIYSWAASINVTYRMAERQPDGSYVVEYESAICGDDCCAEAFASGDLDGDGKSEVVVLNTFYVRVFEAVDSQSHPSTMTWESAPISNVIGYPIVADTDRDGNMEILHLLNTFGADGGVFIFENTGDDMFEEKYFGAMPDGGASREQLVGDLDGDGLTEIAIPGDSGEIYVFESPEDDVWAVTVVIATGLSGTRAIEGPVDTDLDGRNEFLVYGTVNLAGNIVKRTMVYEAIANDTFLPIDMFDQDDNTTGGSRNVLADLSGDGGLTYLMSGRGILYAYEPVGDGTWSYLGAIEDPECCLHVEPLVIDLNDNGRDEIWWRAGADSTLVLEAPVTSSAGDFNVARPLLVSPNPVRDRTRLFYQGTREQQRYQFSVYDVAGRRVSRRERISGVTWTWQPSNLPSGVYILRLERPSGVPVASTRATVLR